MEEQETRPRSVLENVMLLEQGPDAVGRYTYTVFWLQGKKRVAQIFHGDPYLHIHGYRGQQTRIIDQTGNWKGKRQYP